MKCNPILMKVRMLKQTGSTKPYILYNPIW